MHMPSMVIATVSLLFAQAAISAPLYRVEATLTYADGPDYQPSLLLEAERAASLSQSGEPGYEWQIELSDADLEQGQITVNNDLRIADAHYQPQLRVALGEPAQIEVGELKLRLLVARQAQTAAPAGED